MYIYIRTVAQPDTSLPDGHFPEDTSPTNSSTMDSYPKHFSPTGQ